MEAIGTHSGTFHCDEALACYMLRCLPRFSESKVVRSRDPKILSQLAIVVDVGDVYNPNNLRFDHHQKGFFETFSPNHTTKLSSAGLIYKHYGLEVIRNIASVLSADECEIIYNKVYDSFIEGLDGIDNGISQYKCSDSNCTMGVTRCYNIDSDISSRVGRLNPAWNEEVDDAEMDRRFQKAMDLVGIEFRDRVTGYANIWLPGRKIVEEAFKNRMQYDSKGRIILFEQYCPWKDHLHTLEKEINCSEPILYAIYPDYSQSWRVQAVSIQPGAFTNRLSLPAEWRGIRDAELSDASNIDGCIFVHNTGFIGGNFTKLGAIMMAKKSIELQIKH